MKNIQPFSLDSETPGIILKIKAAGKSSIDLLIKGVHDSILQIRKDKGLGNLLNHLVVDLCPEDEQAFEEWEEVVLRMRNMPYVNLYVSEGRETVSSHMLQYFHLFHDWRIVRLTYKKDHSFVMVEFKSPADFAERTLLRQLTTLKQFRMMSQREENEGHWTIDSVNQKIFLSRGMARMLDFGRRAMVVPMRQFFETIHLGDIEKVLTILDDMNESLRSFSHRAILKDGRTLQMYSNATPIYGPDGGLLRIFGITKNETVRIENEQASFLSTHDILTKTYNRSKLWSILQNLQEEKKNNFCLVLLDVNGMKMINNVFGQLKGDKVLLDVADVICNAFPNDRDIARINGGEFAAVIYNTNMDEIERSCETISQFCQRTNRRLLPISIAWGIACSMETDGDAQALFSLAETRMYINKIHHKQSLHSQVRLSLKEALKSRNAETSDHLNRMEKMVTALGKKLRLSNNDFDRLLLLASMHDVGKLGIPDDIINKPGKLTDEEWKTMKGHSDIGYRIAMASQELSDIGEEILSHHERWDGNGYPRKKAGEEIPLLSRIISIVDTYDVITHKRIYKEAQSHEYAVAELIRGKGTQFDPQIVDLFLEIIEEELADLHPGEDF